MKRIKDLEPHTLASLEADWKLGLLSKAVIAAKYNVDVRDLTASAEEYGWDGPDLGGAVRTAHQRAVIAGPDKADGDLTVEDVKAYGKRMAESTEAHIQLGTIGRQIADRLIRKLDSVMTFEADEDAVTSIADYLNAENPKLAETLRKSKHDDPKDRLLQLAIIRAGAQTLMDIAKPAVAFVEIERTALGLDKPQAPSTAATYDDILDTIHGEQPEKPKLKLVGSNKKRD